MVTFIIQGEPVGKGRPRFANGHCYTPKKTRSYEDMVKLSWMTAKNRPINPHDGPICIEVDVYHAIPASTPKIRRDEVLASLPQKVPDLDNCIKSVTDALNGLAYIDDKQIVGIIGRKYFAEFGRVEVRVTRL